MKQKVILFISLLLLSALISGCINNVARYTDLAVEENDISWCDKIRQGFANYNCYTKVALEYEDLETCDLINHSFLTGNCYKEISIKTNDLSVCEQISVDDMKIECLTSIAGTTGNISICYLINTKIVTMKYSCYTAVARTTHNLTYCDLIDESGFRNTCINNIALEKNNQSLCEDNSLPYDKAMCYRGYGMRSDDMFVCEVLDVGWKEICIFGPVEGIQKQDLSFCDKMENDNDKAMCFSYIAQRDKNSSLCDLIEINSVPMRAHKDSCFRYFAIEFKDAHYCERISLFSTKQSCYWMLADKTKDVSVCEKINDADTKETCYWRAQND